MATAMMLALTKAGVFPSPKFLQEQEAINKKKQEAKLKREQEKQAAEKPVVATD